MDLQQQLETARANRDEWMGISGDLLKRLQKALAINTELATFVKEIADDDLGRASGGLRERASLLLAKIKEQL